ncbi:hypothetical protein GOBAR_DD29535 [Gossypium barbadense]|nr:hypothetical protein GOBAR_DD29535 [Gossypium barbadense]
MEDLIPKKFQFRDKDESVNKELLVDLTIEPITPWKNKLIGQSSNIEGKGLEEKEEFELLEGDILKSVINGTPSVEFSNRIHQILIRDMENTVVLKLLGHNIGYSVLQNKIYNLWKPSSLFQLMDIENVYFLAKFQNKIDCEKVLAEGHWTFRLTRIVLQVENSYRNKGLIGKVVKLDMNTDNRVRGRFACMAVYVNLDKPLVSQVLINGKIQRDEYELLPTVSFHYGRYVHVKEVCPFRVCEPNSWKIAPSLETLLEVVSMVVDGTGEKSKTYDP